MTERIDSTVGYFLGSQFPILRSQRLEAAAMDVAVQSAQSVIRFFLARLKNWFVRPL